MTSLEALNQSLFLSLNATVATPAWKLLAAGILADEFIYLIPVLLISLWLWGADEQRSLALKVVAITCTALAVNQVIGWLWPHPRPFMMGLGHTFIPHASDSSFPSDHATVFAAVGLPLVLANCRSVLAWTTIILGVCVAWARVYLGAHFPFDMVGALAVVALVCIIFSPIWRFVGEPVTALASRLYRMLFGRPIAFGWIRH